MGRPSKLTPERVEIIAQAIEDGLSRQSAANMAGIHKATLQDWLAKGLGGEEGFTDFSDRVGVSDAKFEAGAIQEIRRGGIKDWRAYAWLLERKDPSNFGRKDPTQVTDKPDVPTEIRVRFAD